MAEHRVQRRLAAILAADMVDYSRLMGVDEASTITRQKAHRKELIDPKIAEYNGRIVKTTGDGLLVEFASTVDAVLCAVEVQRAIAPREADVPENRRIAYRVGINLGEIVIDDDDILGDGVNIAARLEALAEPGGIRISEAVFKNVRGKLDIGFADLGPQQVKNIAEPVATYRVLLDPAYVGKLVAAKRMRARGWRWPALAAGGFALVAVAIAALWWLPWEPAVEPATLERMAFPLPEKPSIAVLPFDNLSGDSEQGYFADGISESIITTLSRIPSMFVIDRMSTFTFKNKPVRVQNVAESLGVRYVLEGSVQRSATRLRVTAQLIDALTGRHLWAGRYDGEIGEIFVLQDEITRKVVTALQVELMEGEQARVWRGQTESTEAYEHYLRGLKHWRLLSMEGNAEAQRLFERAVTLDPSFAAAWVELARTHYLAARFSWSDDPARSTALAAELAQKALAIDDTQADTYAMLSNVAILKRQREKALAYCEKALILNPNAEATAHCARNLSYLDRPEDALALIKRAMRLSPYYPGWYVCIVGHAHRLMGQYDEALAAYRDCRDRVPGSSAIAAVLAATYSLAGQDETARATVKELLKHDARYSLKQFARAALYSSGETERLIAALRKAGLPE